MVRIYYIKKIQGTINKGKGAWGEVQKKPDKSLQQSSPRGVTDDRICEMRSTREAHQRLSAGFFLGTGHFSILCLEHSESPGSLQEERHSAPTIWLAQ